MKFKIMSEALRAQERLHNALTKMESLMNAMGESPEGVAVSIALPDEVEQIKRENTKLRNAQEQAKLRLDQLISQIEGA